MSHERVVEKRGKTYGPYLYESYRDKDGKVKKRYLGKVVEQPNSSKFVTGFLVFALVICLLIIGSWTLTGRATLSVDEVGVDNGILTGKILFVLQQSELIPADTQIIAHHGSFEQIYNLSDLVSDESVSGDFFVQGKDISGNGLGYSTDSERFPLVNFTLGIYSAKGGSSYTIPDNETSQENQTESGTRTISGNSIRTFITGMLIDESQYDLVEEINASVRYNESFAYELDEDETADILYSEQSVALTIENGQAIVTTDYLGEDTKTLEIDVEGLNITAENADLIISFVYNGTEIDSAAREITLEEILDLNETNETNVTNVTLELPRFGIELDDLAYVILNSSAGKNQTNENLTVYTNQDTNNSLKLVRNWYRNNTALAFLNMPFEGGSNSTFTRDYSPYAKNGTVALSGVGSWDNSSGHDGFGAYIFNSTANLAYKYWNNTTTSGAPVARAEHAGVWNGTDMIVWGGQNSVGGYVNTGGRYNPVSNTWNATTTTGAPSARAYVKAAWAGDRMIVWGGYDGGGLSGTGSRYNPIANTWSATNTTNAPSPRYYHTVTPIGDRVIVWGGEEAFTTYTNTGAIYDPATNIWTNITITNAPEARKDHTAVWTGTELIIWGGQGGAGSLNSGGRYNPATDTWINTSASGLSQRYAHSAVWNGSVMIIWGGQGAALENTGSRYNPISNTWSATTATNAPFGRRGHTGLFINNEMIIWGGSTGGDANDGGHYNPVSNTWTATNNTSAIEGRQLQISVATKNAMIIWGGAIAGTVTNTGGRYYVNSQNGASVSVINQSLNSSQGTISAWINATNASDSNAEGIVTNYYTSTSQGIGIELRNNDITFIARNSTGGGCNITTSSNVIQNNNWYHIVGVWNSSNCTLYINGQLNGTATSPASFNVFGEDIGVGAYNYFDGNFFSGTVDDVTIFNESFGVEQISALYNDRTDLIVSNETEIGETWKACVTANDLTSDSNESCSNNLTIFNSSALCNTNISSDTLLVGNLSCLGTALTIITNNTILDCNGSYLFGNGSGYGVDTYGNQNITIKNCWIQNFSYGAGSSKLAGGVGIYLYNNNITNNTLFNNTYGISQPTQCNILGNNISGGLRGINVPSSPAGSSNLITGNRITNNSAYGIYMFDPSYNNVTNNYFNNPSVNVYSPSGSNNNFNATYNCSISGYANIMGGTCQGGNFWNNYTGADDGSGSYPHNVSYDGIGDTNIPYNSSLGSAGDYLPLMLTMGPASGLLNMTLISPPNYNATNASSVVFNCSANGTGLSNITLFVWNSTNLIYSNTSNVTGSYNYTSFNVSNLTYGILEWNCLGFSSLSNESADSNNTLIRYSNITNIPTITLLNPENASVKVNNNVTFIYEAYSVIVSNLTCFLALDNLSVANSSNVSGRDTIYYNVSDGNHTWRVLCIDNESNAGTSLEYEFIVNTSITDSSDPIIDLQSPANNKVYYVLTTKNITFLYNASDDYGDLFCTFYSNISGSWQANENHTNYPVANEEWISFIYENISTNNTYIWNVMCNDSSGNSAFNSTNFTFNLVLPGACECSSCADCQARLMDLSCRNVTATADFNYTGTGVCIDKSKVIGQEAITFNGNGSTINGVDGDGTGILLGGGGLVDIYMVIDTSGSMLDEGKLPAAKSGARAFVDEVGGNYSIGLIEFDDDANIVINLTTNRTLVKNGIDTLAYDGGWTGIGLGIIKAVSNYNLTNPNRTRIMVLLSDGKNNRPTNNSSALPNPAANYAAENNVTIYTIAYGQDSDRGLMNNIASITGGEYFYSPSNETIRQTYLDILDAFVNIVNHSIINVSVQSFRTCVNLTKTYYSSIDNMILYNCSNISLDMIESEQDNVGNLNVFDTGNTGVRIYTSPNNNFTNVLVNNTGTGDGFYVYHSNNTGFEDIEVSYGDDDGFYVQSNLTSFDNITLKYNMDIGMEFYRSKNNTLSNLVLEHNGDGIKLAFSNSSNFSGIYMNNNTAKGTTYGIYIRDNSVSNNFSDVNISQGTIGVYLADSDRNIFDLFYINNTTNTGFYGDSIADNASVSNIVSNNNSQYGIVLQSTYHNLTNAIANYNVLDGISISGRNHRIINVTANNNSDDGVSISGSLTVNELDVIQDITANNNSNTGLKITSLNSSNASNVIANNNLVYGASFSGGGSLFRVNNVSASNNQIGIFIGTTNSVYTNNSAINNTDYSYYVGSALQTSSCRNTVKTDNVGGINGKPFLYVNDTTSYDAGNSSNYSEIEFCNVNTSRINNVTISNPGVTSDGILLINTRNVNVTNSNLSDVYLGVYGLTYYTPVTYYNLSNNTISNTDGNGINIQSNNPNIRVDLFYNNISNSGSKGAYVQGTNNSIFEGNRIINTTSTALDITGVATFRNHTVKYNYFENSSIALNLLSNITVHNNTFFKNQYAIYADVNVVNSTVRNNTINNSSVIGVLLSTDPCAGLDQSSCTNKEQCSWDFGNSVCDYSGSSTCSDTVDNDGDANTDCADFDCTYISPCGSKYPNYIYWNEFNDNVLHADAFFAGEQFNTTASSEAQGNFWDDVISLDIYDTNHNIWGDSGTDYPYSNANGGNVNNSVYDYGPIVQSLPVNAGEIQCEINTNGNWSNCSNVTYDMNLTRVRVNCTDDVAIITNATFMLKNIPDNYVFFNVSNATEISGGWWIYNNTDIFVRDGGMWNLSAVCINNNSQSEGNSTNWVLDWGNLSGVLITNSSNVTQNEFFNFSSQVTCVGGECGNVTSIADPESSNIFSGNTREIQDTCTGLEVESLSDDYFQFYGTCTITSYSDFVKFTSGAYNNECYLTTDYSASCWGGYPCTIVSEYDTIIPSIGDTFNVYENESACCTGGAGGDCPAEDSDGDGVPDSSDTLTGNATNAASSGITNLTFKVNGTYNESPSGINNVTFSDGETLLVKFDWNFNTSNVLNMSLVNITKTSKGIYIQGVNVSKTIYVPVGAGNGICIKNANGVVANAILCNGTSEYLLNDANCNGSSVVINGDSVTCSIISGNYVISGLTHSGGEPQTKGVIPMNSGTPFYTTSGNPNNSSCTAMYKGDVCNVTWNVNATGSAAGNSTWKFYATFNASQYSGVGNNTTAIINITILEANAAPTQATPILNSTTGNNLTSDNLTVYNQSTADVNNDSVKNIINWYKNNTSFYVLNMPFEGGSNSTFAKDYSNHRNGTVVLNGTAQWNSTGGYDGRGAYRFDGDGDFIDLGDDFNLNITSNLTLAVWIKTNSSSPGNVIAKYGINTLNRSYRLTTNLMFPGRIMFRLSSDGNLISANVSSTINVTDNNWHFIVGTYNGTRASLYIDGVLDNSTAYSGGIWGSQENVYLGTEGEDSHISFFNGTIDDVLILNTSLSPEEVSALYNNRTDLIVSQETFVGDTWQACITPNDETQDGNQICSNNLTILNAIPYFNPNLSNQNIAENSTLYYDINCSDADNDSLTYYINDSSKFNLSSSNGSINYTAGFSDAGNYSYNVTCGDGTSNVSQVFNLTITGTNQVPSMITAFVNSTSGNNLTDDNLTCWANATDADLDNLTYNGYWYLNGAQNLSFNTSPVNYTQGVLASVSILSDGNTTKGENWSCNATAYDNVNYSSYLFSNNLTILNAIPYFNPNLTNQSVAENSTLYYDINCSDADNDSLTYYINDSSKFNLSSSNGVINYTAGFNDSGAYSYNVTCGDGTSNVSQVFNLTITGTNQAPSMITAFVNSSTGTNLTDENLTCYVNATDADGNNISYNGFWYLNGSQNLSFSSGNFTQGTLVNVSTLLAGNTTEGENWSCNATAYDNVNYSSYLFSNNLTILNAIPYFNPNLANQSVAENSTLYYDINCSDADNDTLTYYINDSSKFNISSSNGSINYTAGFNDSGAYSYNVTCGDGTANVSQVFNLTVTNTNRVPSMITAFVNSTSGNNVTDDNLTCYVNATDSDGGNVSYSGYWYLNGSQNLSFSTGNFTQGTLVNVSTLLAGNTTEGENWSCNATAYDNVNYSSYLFSNNLTILTAIVCGNGIVETGEQCDLTNLSNETCVTQGYDAGTLSCTASCTFNASECTTTPGPGPGCSNECTPSGEEEEECANSSYSRIRDCGNYDADSCTEWSDWNYSLCSGTCENDTCVGECVEDWNCTSWSSCYNEITTRTCTDLNDCGTELNKPEEQRSCLCTEDWDCEYTLCTQDETYSYTYNCVDLNNCGTEYDKPDRVLCSDRPGDGDGCNSIWNCTAWGLCEIDLRFEDLLDNDVVQEGIQKRLCVDESLCARDREEKMPCDARVDVRAGKARWCDEDYVELYEKSTGRLVSRVKESERIGFLELEKININFLATEFVYCDYCYDGIKDYDETDVDCGGPNCPACIEVSPFFNWLYWLLIFLWASIIIFTTTIILEERQFIAMILREMQRQKAEEALKGIERMAYYQNPNLYPQIREKLKGPKLKLSLKRTERQPSYGYGKSEKGINVARPGIESRYNVRDVSSYKERKQLKKEGFIARKLRQLFERKPSKPVSKPEKLKQLSKPRSEKAGRNISDTRSRLKSDF